MNECQIKLRSAQATKLDRANEICFFLHSGLVMIFLLQIQMDQEESLPQ